MLIVQSNVDRGSVSRWLKLYRAQGVRVGVVERESGFDIVLLLAEVA
jgi:hypothetical protein